MASRNGICALAVVALMLCPTTAIKGAPVAVTGGKSPNGKLAIVVKRDEDTSQGTISVDNEHPYLEDAATGIVIGPLEEVDTDGGGFGHVLENITAFWSADGRFVAVRFRTGRLGENFVIYRVEHPGTSYRAIPQKLPELQTGPNGFKIFTLASHAANMGAMFKKWLSPTEIAVQNYRYFPPYPPTSVDVDFFNGDGLIEIDYAYEQSGWIVAGYKKPPDSGVN